MFIHLCMTDQYKGPFNMNNEATIKNKWKSNKDLIIKHGQVGEMVLLNC